MHLSGRLFQWLVAAAFAAYFPLSHAADGSVVPVSAVTLSKGAVVEPARALPAESAPTGDDAQETADAPRNDIATIISIESAPATEPLLKAINDAGNPKRDLWQRIRVGYAMPELDTELVQENMLWYANRPDYVNRMVERSKRYLFYIVQEVEKRGMPTEIALLPMIESAFNPKAYSRSKAAGIWQFIPSTGRTFGLQQNWWVDSRRDIMAATNAALDYLQKLHDMFGSWELALAGYNWGEGSVQRAIAKNAKKGLPTDYLSLRMPNETRQYVPRLLAVKKLIQSPEAFNVDLGPLPNQPYFAQITLTEHIDVALAAKLAETSLEEFTSLNPHYNRPVIQAKQATTLLLPVDKAEVFASNLEGYNKPLVSWHPYQAKRGEKVDAIASRFGISAARLKEINGISTRSRRLASGQTLLVPGAAKETALTAAKFTEIKTADEDTGGSGRIYTVKKGDTLLSIAKKQGVKAEQIKAWNHLKSNRLALNQKLSLGSPKLETTNTKTAKSEKPVKVAKSAAPKSKVYTIRRGDTLSSIAQRFDVEVDELRRWNKLAPKTRLMPGRKVTIYLAQNG